MEAILQAGRRWPGSIAISLPEVKSHTLGAGTQGRRCCGEVAVGGVPWQAAAAMSSPTYFDAEGVLDTLAARQLLIVSGKGGVGRTTVAALLGLALARRGRKVLVATVGLDDRLAWMLGQEKLLDVPTP
ncbi:MAG: ArsA-related P-loop ATPase, partial [Nannocystaceae bacterium]